MTEHEDLRAVQRRHFLAPPVTQLSVLGLGEDLRAGAESQATAHFPGEGQMLSRGTPGLGIRTRVPQGP